ncbi:VWA domain-containing protein [Bdellovibrio sp. HCB2-146]|uniref:VWA domain-containing protein n=1 Tax=Bdellovibrio sp. HCB2-146 TaxID=3394362 RepID=UPI0039BD8C5E
MKLFQRFIATFAVLFILAGCDTNSATKLVPKPVIPDVEYSEKPTDVAYFSPKVDILFVIDNSGSMSSVQKSLETNAYMFADALSKMPVLDYHVGVISTDMERYTESGKLQGYPSYVERTTPNLVQSLSRRMVLGTGGSVTEVMFTPVMAALSPALEAGENAGFYRQDAYLAIIIITDANEQSRTSPKEFMDFLIRKKVDKRKILGYGVIRTVANAKVCTAGEDVDSKLEEFLAMTANGNAKQDNILSLCSTDYGTKLAEFAQDIVERSAGSVKLGRIPKRETIRVKWGTQEIPNDYHMGWTYRDATNTIEFGHQIQWSQQPDGTQLSIVYDIIDLN